MADTRTIVNGWKVPKGQGGNAIRYMVQEIMKSPRKALPMKILFEQACLWAPLNYSTAGWLTLPSDYKSPIGHIFERFKDENHKYFQLRLLPGAEVLDKTYVDPWKQHKEEILLLAKQKGMELGAMFEVMSRNPVSTLERNAGKGLFALIISITENQYTINFNVLLNDEKYCFPIEAFGEKIS